MLRALKAIKSTLNQYSQWKLVQPLEEKNLVHFEKLLQKVITEGIGLGLVNCIFSRFLISSPEHGYRSDAAN